MKTGLYALFFLGCLIPSLSSTPNLKNEDLTGILTDCTHTQFSFVHAISFLHSGSIKDIRMAHSIEYKENTDTALFLAEIRRNLPTFIAEHYEKFITKTKGEISTNAYISTTPFSRLIAFLFPTHNGKFETNAFTSHFLGNGLGVPIIKDIINVLTSDKFLPLPTQAMIIAKITKRPKNTRNQHLLLT